MFAGGHKAGGRHDFLGYYHLLGLTGRPQASVSAKDIKQAFRRLALKWHPDKHEVGACRGRLGLALAWSGQQMQGARPAKLVVHATNFGTVAGAMHLPCMLVAQGQDLDVAAKQQARQRFAELRAAYEVLNDPEKRRQYDNGQHVRP